MACHLFTYGSLMFAPVWESVVHGKYRPTPAVLHDHARYAIPGASYPGMVPQSGAQVEGVLYFDVSDEDLTILDRFEGEDYRRSMVLVRTGRGELLTAATYLWQDHGRLDPAPWEPGRFRPQHFLQTHCSQNRKD